MQNHPEVGVVFCDYRNFDARGPAPKSHFQTCARLWSQLIGRQELILESPLEHLTQENFGIAGSFLMRRALLRFEPGFEPTLRSCEDFHYYFRLARHRQVGVINEVGIMRRLHGRNMSSNLLTMLNERIRSRALLREGEFDPRIREHLGGYIAECHESCARYFADRGQYLHAMREHERALKFHVSTGQLWMFCRGVARTVAIAARAHRPRVDER
jgi:hypothetical protein